MIQVVKQGQTVGEVTRYTLSEEESRERNIYRIIQDHGIFDFENPPADYMLESSLYADWQLSYGTAEEETLHHFFLFNGYMYDLCIGPAGTKDGKDGEIARQFAEEILPDLQ